MDGIEFHLSDVEWTACAPKLSAIRKVVFIEEQGVPAELEWDGRDPESRHVLAETHAGVAIATGRLLAGGQIGRMAVLCAYRNRGVGSAVLVRLIDRARNETRLERVFLHAQTRAITFYARHGFRAEGDEFIEAGIPHRAMALRLDR
ncbi:MAG: GNAT family N-acetyltransferase [Thiotrichales bacterium]